MQRKELHGDGREGKEQHKYNRRGGASHIGHKGVSSEGTELSSQFRPNNEADQYDKDDNDNGGDKTLLIHPVIEINVHLDPPDKRISA